MILSAIAEKLKRQSKDDFKGRHFEASLILQAVTDHGKDSDEILTHRPAWLTGEGLSPNRVCTKPC